MPRSAIVGTPSPEVDCLLDTHIWFWLVTGDSTLQRGALHLIEEAAERDRVLVSIISVWEIGMLDAKERLVLHVPCDDWIDAALAQPAMALLPITPRIATASSRLPGAFHGDPADRILVATARALNVPLFTRDREILAYGRRGHVKAVRA